jgi:hypothetical protein
MPVTIYGPVSVAIAVWIFGFLLFKGMTLEWHRRDAESHHPTR